MMIPYLFTHGQSADLDQRCIQFGLPEKQLMGQAALAAYFQLEMDQYLPLQGKAAIWVLCGSGNNGGDGLALAWFLASQSPHISNPKEQIRIFLHQEGPKSAAAQFYWQCCQKTPVPMLTLMDFLQEEIREDTLIIDALLGTGASGPLRDPYLSVLTKLSRHRVRTVSLDIPSGPLINPEKVFSFGVGKLSVALDPQLPSSRVKVLPMGFPSDLLEKVAVKAKTSAAPVPLSWDKDPSSLSTFKKERAQHKYQSGSGLIVGGSPGMEGALILSSKAFFAAGGGICQCLCPEENSRKNLLAEEWGGIYRSFKHPDLEKGLLLDLPKALGVVVGPGLSSMEHDEDARLDFAKIMEVLTTQAHREDFTFILDAGFLAFHQHLLAKLLQAQDRRCQVLLTPHRGELARLGLTFGGTAEEIPALQEFCQKLGAWVLVKDAVSVLCGPAKECYVWNHAAPHLSVAGSGDVLTGILLAAFTRKRSPENQVHLPELVHRSLILHQLGHLDVIHPTASLLVKGIGELINSLN